MSVEFQESYRTENNFLQSGTDKFSRYFNNNNQENHFQYSDSGDKKGFNTQ